MIFNCHKCAKSISTKKDLCPYCKADISEIGLLVEKAAMSREHGGLKLSERLKGTFAAILG